MAMDRFGDIKLLGKASQLNRQRAGVARAASVAMHSQLPRFLVLCFLLVLYYQARLFYLIRRKV